LTWNSYQNYAESLTAAFRMPIVNTADDLVRDRQLSQEVQLIGDAFDNRVSYVGGLYYFDEDASHFNYGTIPSYALIKERLVKMNSKSYAAFGQLTWTPPVLDDRLGLTFGARYTEDERSASRVFITNGTVMENGAADGAVNDQDFSRFNPSFTASYTWTDDLSTYVKVSTGYKAGGSSEAAPIGSFNLTFGPEEVTVYELGMKSYWFDRRLRLKIPEFDNQIEDMQMAFGVNPLDG
jgi:iron complex outermembrane receptor protein